MDLLLTLLISLALLCSSVYAESILVKTLDDNGRLVYSTDYSIKNTSCKIMVQDAKAQVDFQSYLNDRAKLIYITLDFSNTNMSQPRDSIFQPLSWSYTTGKQGRGILRTTPIAKFLSVGTLSIGVEHVRVNVSQEPPECLSQSSNFHYESLIRQFILEKMSLTFDSTQHICNERILNVNRYAVYEQMCCNKQDDGYMDCYYLENDIWNTVLVISIITIKLGCLLFAANLIPVSFYKQRYGYDEYSYEPAPQLYIRVKQQENKPADVLKKDIINISHLGLLEDSSNDLMSDKISDNAGFTATVSRIWFKVQPSRLVDDNYVPVGIVSFIYHRLFRCKCYKIQENILVDANSDGTENGPFTVRQCCKMEVCDIFGRKILWNSIFRSIMQTVMLVIVLSPFIARVLIYVYLESTNEMSRKEAARDMQLAYIPPYQSFSFISWLSPTHPIYFNMYVIFFISFLTHPVLMFFPNYYVKLIILIRSSIREMTENQDGFSWRWGTRFTVLIFKPLKRHQILATILWIPWLLVSSIIIIIVFFLNNLPTVNVILRIIWNFVKEICPVGRENRKYSYWLLNVPQNTRRGPSRAQEIKELKAAPSTMFWKIGCVIWILFIICIIPILADIVFTLVDTGIYTLIGIILNSSTTMKFVTIIFMLVLYGNDCFGSVTKKYAAFNKKIRSVILGRTKDKVKAVAEKAEKDQVNTAFQVLPGGSDQDDNSPLQGSFKVKQGQVRWKSKHIIEFLNKDDSLYLTQKFFFGSCYMPYYGCPGKLKLNLYGAAVQFMVIILFLLFVLFVVYSYGDAMKVSGTNQMLATLAGGFLPFIFRRVLFQSVDGFSLDEKDYKFQICLDSLLKKYQQTWNISDFELTDINPSVPDDDSDNPYKDFTANCGTIWIKTEEQKRYAKLEIYQPDAVAEDEGQQSLEVRIQISDPNDPNQGIPLKVIT